MATEKAIEGYRSGFPLKLRVYLTDAAGPKASGTVVIWIATTEGGQAVAGANAVHDADGYWDLEVSAEDMATFTPGSVAQYQIHETDEDPYLFGPLRIGKGLTAPA